MTAKHVMSSLRRFLWKTSLYVNKTTRPSRGNLVPRAFSLAWNEVASQGTKTKVRDETRQTILVSHKRPVIVLIILKRLGENHAYSGEVYGLYVIHAFLKFIKKLRGHIITE